LLLQSEYELAETAADHADDLDDVPLAEGRAGKLGALQDPFVELHGDGPWVDSQRRQVVAKLGRAFKLDVAAVDAELDHDRGSAWNGRIAA
jgi:hypothetical protein